MKIKLLCTGKTSKDYYKQAIREYEKRISKYISFDTVEINTGKISSNFDKERIKNMEGDLILKTVNKNENIILLDENGKSHSSVSFAQYLNKYFLYENKDLVFVTGGAYGFSDKLYKSVYGKISLSKMTYSHQIIRPIFLEQLYRAFTIIKGEPYHNE